MIKALTLWQPWASAIALGLKKYETRHWATNHRGALAIHASAKPMTATHRALAEKYGMCDVPGGCDFLPLGAVVVICNLKGCIQMTQKFIDDQSQMELAFGDWAPGRFAWELEILNVLTAPLPVCGHQGLWNLGGFEEYDAKRQMELF